MRRYYALIHHYLLELSWTEGEAQLICEALKDYHLEEDSEGAQMIWKQVQAGIHRDNLARKWNVNQATFNPKILALHHIQAIALVDAVERYWVRTLSQPHESLQTRLKSVGLVLDYASNSSF